MSFQAAGPLESFPTQIAEIILVPTRESCAVFLLHVVSQLGSGVKHFVTGLAGVLVSLINMTMEASPGGELLPTAVAAGDFFIKLNMDPSVVFFQVSLRLE